MQNRIKVLREDADLTQAKLGSIIGVNSHTISCYELGTSQPNMQTLTQLAEYFNVTIDYLVGRTDINTMQLKAAIHYRQVIKNIKKLTDRIR